MPFPYFIKLELLLKKQQHYQRRICTNILQKRRLLVSAPSRAGRRIDTVQQRHLKCIQLLETPFPPVQTTADEEHCTGSISELLFFPGRQGADGYQPTTIKALLSHFNWFKSLGGFKSKSLGEFKSLGNNSGLPGTCFLTKPPSPPSLKFLVRFLLIEQGISEMLPSRPKARRWPELSI